MLEIIAEIYLGTAAVMSKIVTFLICYSFAKKQMIAHPLLTPVILLFYIFLGYPFLKVIVEGISGIISVLFENYLESKNGFWYEWKYGNRSWYQGTNRERRDRYRSNHAESRNWYQSSWEESQNRYQSSWEESRNRYQSNRGNSQYQGNRGSNGQGNGNQSGQNGRSSFSGAEPELRDALAFYGFSIPFSEAQLKTAHRNFMKKAHPDAGGDEEYAKKVNVYYDVLRKYVDAA